MLEAVTGPLYLAILVARLVSLGVASDAEPRRKPTLRYRFADWAPGSGATPQDTTDASCPVGGCPGHLLVPFGVRRGTARVAARSRPTSWPARRVRSDLSVLTDARPGPTGHNRTGDPPRRRDQAGRNSVRIMHMTVGETRQILMRESRPMSGAPEAEDVVEQLDRILASGDFDASPRSRAFIRFIVEETLAGRQEALTQAAIATRVFARREDFDPTVDPIVRIQAGRLRRSLERYYLLSGAGDPVRIELPRGSYVPVARWGARARSVPARRARRAGPRGPRRLALRRGASIRGRRHRRGARGGGVAAQGAALPRDGPLRRRARGAAARARPARPCPLRVRRLRPLGTSLPRRSDHAHHRAPAGLP